MIPIRIINKPFFKERTIITGIPMINRIAPAKVITRNNNFTKSFSVIMASSFRTTISPFSGSPHSIENLLNFNSYGAGGGTIVNITTVVPPKTIRVAMLMINKSIFFSSKENFPILERFHYRFWKGFTSPKVKHLFFQFIFPSDGRGESSLSVICLQFSVFRSKLTCFQFFGL